MRCDLRWWLTSELRNRRVKMRHSMMLSSLHNNVLYSYITPAIFSSRMISYSRKAGCICTGNGSTDSRSTIRFSSQVDSGSRSSRNTILNMLPERAMAAEVLYRLSHSVTYSKSGNILPRGCRVFGGQAIRMR